MVALPTYWRWLEARSPRYEVIYLDPLVCDPTIRSKPRGLRRLYAGTDPAPHARFITEIWKTLKIEPGDIPDRYLDEKRLGSRLKKDRTLQRRLINVISEQAELGGIPVYHSIRELTRTPPALGALADRPQAASLVIVDATLATRAGLPEPLRPPVTHYADVQSVSDRATECVLSDIPSPLMTLHDRAIGLMVDRRTIYEWTSDFTKILSTTWYPFARAVGLYSTTPGGQPYLQVLVLLMPAYPSMSDVFNARHTTRAAGPAPDGLIETIQHIHTHMLQPTLDRIKGIRARARGAPAPTVRFEWYRQIVLPFHLCKIYCQLHGATASGLKARSSEVYQLLDTYLKAVKDLQLHLDEQSRDLYVPDKIDDLLPEPDTNGAVMQPVAWTY